MLRTLMQHEVTTNQALTPPHGRPRAPAAALRNVQAQEATLLLAALCSAASEQRRTRRTHGVLSQPRGGGRPSEREPRGRPCPAHPRASGTKECKSRMLLRKRKKERKHTTQGRDGRTARRHHTGILRRGVWCASRRPPWGVCLFVSLFAVSRRFSLQPSCHLAAVPLSSVSPLSLPPLSRRSLLPRPATPPPAGPLFLALFFALGFHRAVFLQRTIAAPESIVFQLVTAVRYASSERSPESYRAPDPL